MRDGLPLSGLHRLADKRPIQAGSPLWQATSPEARRSNRCPSAHLPGRLIGLRRQCTVVVVVNRLVDMRRIGQLSRSEEHTSELQSLMRISYAVFCLKKKIKNTKHKQPAKASKQ